jgi:hypothetical protein
MDVLWRVLGVILLLMVLQDIFQTVLFPASGRGVMRKPITEAVWKTFRVLARVARRHQRNVLAYCGPIQIAALIGAWMAMLILGWALIYQPAFGHGIRASSGSTDTSWPAAIYYSGFLVTTLGTGDIVPKSGLWRLLSIGETAMGFAAISMIITYFLSVYTNLTTRNAFAQGLHHRTEDTDDAAHLVRHLVNAADLPDAREELSTISISLRHMYQSHRSYPVLRYFHYREPYYALPTIVRVTLDCTALIKSALDPEAYAAVVCSTRVAETERAATALLEELVPHAVAKEPTVDDLDGWRKRYHAAIACLREAGVRTTPCDDGERRYIDARSQWNFAVEHLATVTLNL